MIGVPRIRPRDLREGRKGTAAGESLRLRSPLLVGWFRRHAEGRLARAFGAARLSREGRPSPPPGGPLLVVLNHPSWWDPLVCLHLTRLFPDRAHFAPMDAAALDRYRFFRRLGFFGVESGTVRGARTFLEECAAILGEPGTAVWITAQGRFADPRERPAGIRSGIARLGRRIGGTLLPLALEYSFWTETRPEALIRFGEPLTLPLAGTIEDVRRRIEGRLEAAQDALGEAARRRDSEAFVTTLEGRRGMGGLYGLWRSLRDRIRGHSSKGAGR